MSGGLRCVAIRPLWRRGQFSSVCLVRSADAPEPWYVDHVIRRLAAPLACALGGLVAIASFAALHRGGPESARATLGIGGVARRAAEQLIGDSLDDELDRPLVLPTGAPTALDCDDARLIIAQARTTLAAEPSSIDAAKFAEATADWLDPHGLWSVAPDAPIGARLRREAGQLLTDIQAEPGSGKCEAAERIGAELASWTSDLRRVYDEAFAKAKTPSLGELWSVATSTPFEDGTVTRSARELAKELGRQTGALLSGYGTDVARYVTAARDRTTPDLDGHGWARAVLAASVRAYVPQLDAHGAWAPLEEEISIYDLALETNPPARLWSEMTRTALGVRIDRGALAPLSNGDVVLAVQDIALAGMSVEQCEQLSVLEGPRADAPMRVTVLRPQLGPTDVWVTPAPVGDATSAPPPEVPVDLVRYADGRAAVLTVSDVPDDLGARVATSIEHARANGNIRGLVLDLRGNGGGSTDGAVSTLGLFLPGATLFPMRRRDGGIEIERAPEQAIDKRWSGPLAVLVDGDSASAAEMLAGAIASYHRGVVLGDRTYGKGCAQEYLDDEAHVGVLRLTTLLFALPDGSPVQKVGIVPNVHLSLPAVPEREAALLRALAPWKGPDVREASMVHDVGWPAHTGRVGPCHDETVCRALRALGAAPAAAR